MHFVKINKNDNTIIYPYTLDTFKDEHKNVSLPESLSNRFLEQWDVYPVYMKDKPEFDHITQFISPEENPELIDGEWKLGWIVRSKTEDQIANDTDQRKKEVRRTRDKLLADTDWVSIRSIDINTPVDPEWAAYRQALRDVTAQEGFPWNVEWPTDPTGFTYTE